MTMAAKILHTRAARLSAWWWRIDIGADCVFHGMPVLRRHPGSVIRMASGCMFNSSPLSNKIGVNRPCMISTLAEDAEIRIGAGCGFSGTVIGCAKSIVLEERVRCGANTLITDTDWHRDDPRAGNDAPVHICRNVWLGANVTVLKGVTIGENTVIAAGSVVTRSLPSDVVAAGVPARVIRRIDYQGTDGD
jgi:acetyltransferase-like isoleucine patch superfamily enzyme